MLDYMPHGHCYYWEPFILWSHAISDSFIAIAYMAIPFSLFHIYYKRKDFTYSWMVVLFAIFIFGCGVTHIFDVINIWYPMYRADAVARIITALASIGTGVVLFKFSPMIVAIPTSAQWKSTNEKLSASNEELRAINEELKATTQKLAQAKEEINILSQKELRQSKQRYKDLAESISDIFVAMDTEFCFTYWNSAIENYTKIKAEVALGQCLYDLYPKLEESPLDLFLKKVMQTGQADKINYHLGLRNDELIHEIKAYPTAEGIKVIATDITDRIRIEEKQKALNQELLRQNEQLQQFGHITSHNLRGPVATMLGLVDVLDLEDLSEEFSKKVIENIKVSARKMDVILYDLHQILQYQTRLDGQNDWVTLDEVLEKVKIFLSKDIEHSGAIIQTDFEVKKIYTIKSYLQNILINLTSNAIKYRKVGHSPIITLKSKAVGQKVYLEFSDNGLGFDLKRNKEKIFGLYKRFHSHVKGKGIGLYLVKTQVEALNGTIEVSSEVDSGTTFTLSLPR